MFLIIMSFLQWAAQVTGCRVVTPLLGGGLTNWSGIVHLGKLIVVTQNLVMNIICVAIATKAPGLTAVWSQYICSSTGNIHVVYYYTWGQKRHSLQWPCVCHLNNVSYKGKRCSSYCISMRAIFEALSTWVTAISPTPISPTPILPSYYRSVPFRLLPFRLLSFRLVITAQCHFAYSCKMSTNT